MFLVQALDKELLNHLDYYAVDQDATQFDLYMYYALYGKDNDKQLITAFNKNYENFNETHLAQVKVWLANNGTYRDPPPCPLFMFHMHFMNIFICMDCVS